MSTRDRQPTVYVPHGGGPMSYVDLGFPPHEVEAFVQYWRSLADLAPRALLVVSAHWEAPVPTLMTSARPPMLYDYYGFPAAAYSISWPAPGDPALADRVADLLRAAGHEVATDPERGFDHGTFVPLGRSFPRADVPTVQLSLKAGLDPATHLAIGRALAPLRDEGVLLVGSGLSFHDMRAFARPGPSPAADAFDAWLRETVRLAAEERDARLVAWANAPSARQAHPREEHLLPLMVVAGAAGSDRGEAVFGGTLFGKRVSGIQFGATA